MGSLKKVWWFIWHDDSLLSWVVNIILALIIVKFLLYPGLGLAFGTTHPIVAVVSGSMEHHNLDFDEWWETQGDWYEQNGIGKEEFKLYHFKHGFNKGDIMILLGKRTLDTGDVIVFNGNPTPIIHRIVSVSDGNYVTKGDNNHDKDPFRANSVLGKAALRVPYLGYIKIWFVDLFWGPLRSLLV